MLGAIAGDIIGSVYEFKNTNDYNFLLFSENSKFTDDTILTIAQADSIINNKDWISTLHEYFDKYTNYGYGGGFQTWALNKSREPYNSYGNGSAMRISPIAWYYTKTSLTKKINYDIEIILDKAKQSAEVTHNHPEGIKGAQAIALCIFLSLYNWTKHEIKDFIETKYDYNLSKSLKQLTTTAYLKPIEKKKKIIYKTSCQETIEQAICAFLLSEDFEDCIRKAIMVGGDSDTIACMAGSIAEAYYHGVPKYIEEEVYKRLDEHLLKILLQFQEIII